MTRVKICGITNAEDALAAVELGADALGFIFVPASPRFVGADPGFIDLLKSVPPFVSRVGVCTDPDSIAADVLDHLDVLQVYDHASLQSCGIGKRIIPAFRVRSREDLHLIERGAAAAHARTVLLDAYHDTTLGGGGVVFDWGLAAEAGKIPGVRIVLAGGLTPANVAQAISQARPYAVDVSTGVEAGVPGRKDHGMIKRFIEAVHQT